MSQRWIVLGGTGMLGRDLLATLRAAGDIWVDAPSRAELDLRDARAIDRTVRDYDVVVNAAGHTDVDGAEADAEAAMAVNGHAVGRLAAAVAEGTGALLHISSDYVFAGDATAPYAEDAPTAPINEYGRGKLAGERAVLRQLPDRGYVVRTAWLYGAGGRNFVTTILRLAGERDVLDVVDDQRGQPTWSRALGRQLVALAEAAAAGRAPAGIYHGTAAGETTWYGLARETFALAGLDPQRIRPTTSGAHPRPARRPAYSVLGHDRWRAVGIAPMAHWRDTLASAIDELR